jgi:bacillithiol biosynthesis deacetylase BshB1
MRIVACGAHPDDVEICCGGTVALSVRIGHAVGILDLTGGELGSNGTEEERAREAAAAAEILGVGERHNAHLPDGGLSAADPEQMRAVVEWIRRLRPEILLIPPERCRHPDHRQAHVLLRDAAFKAGLRQYPAEGKPFRPRALYQYLERFPFEPSFLIDTSAVGALKRKALGAYVSQFARREGTTGTLINDPGFLGAIEARDSYWGGQAGCKLAEPFLAATTPVLKDMAALAGGEPSAGLTDGEDENE